MNTTERDWSPAVTFSFEEKLRYLEEVFAWLDAQTSDFLGSIKAESAEIRAQYTLFAEENRQLREELIRDYRSMVQDRKPLVEALLGRGR
jgi:hypothetical protein